MPETAILGFKDNFWGCMHVSEYFSNGMSTQYRELLLTDEVS